MLQRKKEKFKLHFSNVAKLRISWEKSNSNEDVKSHRNVLIMHILCTPNAIGNRHACTVLTRTLAVLLHHALPLMFSCDHASADRLAANRSKKGSCVNGFRRRNIFASLADAELRTAITINTFQI